MKPTNETGVTDSPKDIARGSLQQHGSANCGYCIWTDTKKKMVDPCNASENGDWLCTRRRGHSGMHVACIPGNHKIHSWLNGESSHAGPVTPGLG